MIQSVHKSRRETRRKRIACENRLMPRGFFVIKKRPSQLRYIASFRYIVSTRKRGWSWNQDTQQVECPGFKNCGGKSPVYLSVAGAARHAQIDGTFAPTVFKFSEWLCLTNASCVSIF